MSRLNISLSGHQITDEVIYRTNSTAAKLAHDTIRFVGADFEIWTGAGKTGSKLAITTDYVLNGEDTEYTAEVGVPVYTTVSIVNGTQQNKSLYVTYKTCGDYTSVENIKAIFQHEVSGTATFTNANNNINLAGIGAIEGLEIGDVIQISGSAKATNNSEFTVENITNSDNIVVNYEHRGGSSSKSLTNETAKAGVTVKLLCKWFNAPLGLGQGWVGKSGVSERFINSNYSYIANRSMCFAGSLKALNADVVITAFSGVNGTFSQTSGIASTLGFFCTVAHGEVYRLTKSGTGTSSTLTWAEFR